MESTAVVENKGYIKVENVGEIDVAGIMLLGATSKRGDDSKIGYFGSGLKYAIAVLLREEIPFRIFAGEKEIKVTLTTKKFRGQNLKVIKINNQMTSLTTEMGPTWEPWFAIREIYCNAIDEGDYKLTTAGEPVGEKGKTIIYIANHDKLKELFSHWDNYFSDRRKDLIVESDSYETKVYGSFGKQLIIYRKGVRAYSDKVDALYHYDLGWIKINESRVLESTFDLRYRLPQMWARIATPQMIANLFDNYRGSWEAGLSWSSVSAFNSSWLDVLGGRKIVVDLVAGYFAEEMASQDCIVLPQELAESLHSYFGNKVTVLGRSDSHDNGFQLEMNARQGQYIKDSIEFLKKCDIEVTYPFVIWKFKSESVLGQAHDGTIRLSPALFDKGKREVVITIIEEMAHLQSGASDKTRSFQNFIFNRLLLLLEEKAGERL